MPKLSANTNSTTTYKNKFPSSETHQKHCRSVTIPIEIWEAPGLNWMQRCLWGEIHVLNGPDGCFASNEYLAKKMGVNEQNLRKALAKLKQLELIYQESFDGRKRVLRTRYPQHPNDPKKTGRNHNENTNNENVTESFENEETGRGLEIERAEGSKSSGLIRDFPMPPLIYERRSIDTSPLPPKGDAPRGAEEVFLKNFLEMQKAYKPDFAGKVSVSWRKDAERLLKIRTMDQLLAVLEFSLKIKFSYPVIDRPKRLLDNLDALEMRMRGKPTGGSTVEENKRYAERASLENNPGRVEVLNTYVEIHPHPACLSYEDKEFQGKICHELRKRSYIVPRTLQDRTKHPQTYG